jgi:hypothetical protein
MVNITNLVASVAIGAGEDLSPLCDQIDGPSAFIPQYKPQWSPHYCIIPKKLEKTVKAMMPPLCPGLCYASDNGMGWIVRILVE